MTTEQSGLNQVESQFPTKLKALREEQGLTRKELAEKLTTDSLSFSVSSIASYESGRSWPRLRRGIRLCEVLNVTLAYLFGDGEREEFGVIAQSSDDDKIKKLAEYLDKTGDLGKMEEAYRTGGEAKLEEYALGVIARLELEIKAGKFSLTE